MVQQIAPLPTHVYSKGFSIVLLINITCLHTFCKVYPDVAKAGGLQSQGVEGEAVVVYRELLTTPALMSSGFPVG